MSQVPAIFRLKSKISMIIINIFILHLKAFVSGSKGAVAFVWINTSAKYQIMNESVT